MASQPQRRIQPQTPPTLLQYGPTNYLVTQYSHHHGRLERQPRKHHPNINRRHVPNHTQPLNLPHNHPQPPTAARHQPFTPYHPEEPPQTMGFPSSLSPLAHHTRRNPTPNPRPHSTPPHYYHPSNFHQHTTRTFGMGNRHQ